MRRAWNPLSGRPRRPWIWPGAIGNELSVWPRPVPSRASVWTKRERPKRWPRPVSGRPRPGSDSSNSRGMVGRDAPFADGAFILRAPIDGVLAESNGTPGAAVEEGQRLFRMVAVDTVHVLCRVARSGDREAGGSGRGGDRRIRAGRNRCLWGASSPGAGSSIPHRARFPSSSRPATATGRLAIGQAVLVRLFSDQATPAPAIPESAVVDDAGRPVVFVQAAGESFLRRPVRLGGREGGIVQILEGLKAGERVVTTGAHQIRLSALSPQVPAHGHVH